MTDSELLEEFRDRKSDAAFSTLVGRHAGWVFAVARRRVGDEHLAHDVAQAVFVLFAEQASQIRDPARLCGWLMRATVHAANHATRGERRRKIRERTVAENRSEIHTAGDPSVVLANLGDLAAVEEAVGRLNESDRSAIVLRFYRGMSLAEVGESLGISEEAARKRVDRALSRLPPPPRVARCHRRSLRRPARRPFVDEPAGVGRKNSIFRVARGERGQTNPVDPNRSQTHATSHPNQSSCNCCNCPSGSHRRCSAGVRRLVG